MGELILFDNKNKGKVIHMGKKDKKKIVVSEGSNKPKELSWWEKAWAVINGSILGPIIVIVGIIGAINVISQMNDSDIIENASRDNIMKEMQSQLAEIQTDISGLSDQYSEVDKYLHQNGGVEDQLEDINEALNLKVINVTDDNTLSSITNLATEGVNIDISSSSLSEGICLGIDSDGNTYLAKDMVGKTILLTYTEGDKEVYFLGQYNEKYHWDGYCVFNSYYLDGTLFGICEANYEDGKCIDYKAFTKDGSNWILSDKFYDENGEDTGINITYKLEYNNVKNFTNTNARITDIFSVEKFVKVVDETVYQYYSGKTVDGWYNDPTGSAYLVTYNEDGTVKGLFYGVFANGYLDKGAESSWSIEYLEDYDYYVYLEDEQDSIFDSQVSTEQIEDILSGYDIKCELNWK